MSSYGKPPKDREISLVKNERKKSRSLRYNFTFYSLRNRDIFPELCGIDGV